MKIGIDIDEVVVEFTRGFINFYNSKFDKDIKFENWHSYKFWEVVGGTKEQAIQLVDDFYDTRGFDELKLVEGAKESINELKKENEILFITSRPIRFKLKTDVFFKKHFSEVPITILYSDDFHKQHSIGKAGICKRDNIEIFIEDNLEYALSCSREGVKTFLLNRPWNQRNFENNGIIRVNNWDEILEKINELNKK